MHAALCTNRIVIKCTLINNYCNMVLDSMIKDHILTTSIIIIPYMLVVKHSC